MKQKPKKSLRYYMRLLHNNVGFFIVGLVAIYSLSGIVQTYRDADIFKQEKPETKTLAPHLNEAKLGEALQLRGFKVIKTEGNVLSFNEGTYNQATGVATYTTKTFYPWILPFSELHKTPSNQVTHYFTALFGLALLFMSVSAFWMFKPGTKLFSRGVYLTLAGIVAAIILLIL